MERDEIEVLKYLTEFDYLEGPAHGIALQVIDKGDATLSDQQTFAFRKYVAERFLNLKCDRCRIEMPTSEVLSALVEEDSLCSWCRKMKSNKD
jgi:hypothetical protein